MWRSGFESQHQYIRFFFTSNHFNLQQMFLRKGGLLGTEVAFLLLNHQPQVWFSAFLKISFNAAEIYQLRWLEEIGLRLDNVDWTHPVLASLWYKKNVLLQLTGWVRHHLNGCENMLEQQIFSFQLINIWIELNEDARLRFGSLRQMWQSKIKR